MGFVQAYETSEMVEEKKLACVMSKAFHRVSRKHTLDDVEVVVAVALHGNFLVCVRTCYKEV